MQAPAAPVKYAEPAFAPAPPKPVYAPAPPAPAPLVISEDQPTSRYQPPPDPERGKIFLSLVDAQFYLASYR